LYKGAIHGRIRRLSKTDWYYLLERKYENGKVRIVVSPTFGHAVSFSKRTTNRPFHPNLQKVTVIENGQKCKKFYAPSAFARWQKQHNRFFICYDKSRRKP